MAGAVAVSAGFSEGCSHRHAPVAANINAATTAARMLRILVDPLAVAVEPLPDFDLTCRSSRNASRSTKQSLIVW